MDTINIYSLNARGLNIPEKRRMLLNDLKRAHIDVALIQETHFRVDKPIYLKNQHFPHVYHATNMATKSKGVSILIAGMVPWICSDTRIDPEGRYIFVKGILRNTQVTIATVYAPNDRQDTFLHRMLNLLMEFQEGQLVLRGDFNTPLKPAVDTSSNTSSMRLSTHKRIVRDLHNAQLIDAYTFYSAPHKVYSRLDYFFIPHRQLEAIHEVEIGNITWSGHAPITMRYCLSSTMNARSKFWRLIVKVFYKHQRS